jgi:hypothetical protein
VNDAAAMRDFDSAADLQEHSEHLLDRKLMLANEASDRCPGHILHHEVGKALLGCPCVEQSRNIRVIEASEDMALSREPLQNLICVGAALQDLDRDLLLECAIRALG